MTIQEFSFPYSLAPATPDVRSSAVPAGFYVWDFVSETLRVGDNAGRNGGKVIDPAGYVRPEFLPGFMESAATDVTTHINAATVLAAGLAAVGRGNGKVALQGGNTYRVKDVDIADGVGLEGDNVGGKSRLLRSGATTRGVIALHAASAGVSIRNLIVDGGSAGETNSLINTLNPSNFTLDNFELRNGMGRWALRFDPTTVCSDIRVTRGKFSNLPAGGVMWLPLIKGHARIKFDDILFDQVGNNALGIHKWDTSPDGSSWDCNFDVTLQGLTFQNPLQTGAAGPIPIELWGATRAIQREIQIFGAWTRGLSAGACMTDGLVESCLVRDQSSYAIECGDMRRVNVRDVVGVNCATLASYTAANEVRDAYFARLRSFGTGLSAYSSGNPADMIKLAPGSYTNLRFQDVKGYDQEYARSYFYLSGADATSTVYLDECGAYSRTPYSALAGVMSDTTSASIRNFVYARTADVPADHYRAAALDFAIRTPTYAGTQKYRLENPVVEFSGALLGSSTLSGIGDPNANAARPGIQIKGGAVRGNFSTGVKMADSGGTAEVTDIDVSEFTGGTATNLHPAVIKYRFLREYEATSIPTAGPSTPKGTFWRNKNVVITTGKVLAGWRKLTDGANYVAGFDITPVYETTS